jgi:hypothetical protein
MIGETLTCDECSRRWSRSKKKRRRPRHWRHGHGIPFVPFSAPAGSPDVPETIGTYTALYSFPFQRLTGCRSEPTASYTAFHSSPFQRFKSGQVRENEVASVYRDTGTL